MIPCTITYKNAKVNPNGKVFLKIQGKCCVCLSDFHSEVINQPESASRVIIDCTYQGKFKGCKSNIKRSVIGEKREELKTKLVNENQSAAYVQRVEAKQVMQYGNKEQSL